MCGITGIYDPAASPDAGLLRRMCARMEHRGPDQHAVHVDGPAGLGIQRLAIIDVAGGDQPIANEDGSVVVVMNGEIYNHATVRDDLRARGHRFSTHADTEVLVHLYEEHGDDCVRHLRGMFAFALWDSRRRRLLMARDRLGKKPLFWTQSGGRVAFASEVSTLLADPRVSRELCPDAIDAYLALQYVPAPLSAFAAVRKLSPGHLMVIDAAGVHAPRRYWSLDYRDRTDDAPPEQLAEELREQLREAVRIRLMSEVPLGAFLSGGIDSSAVVAAMAEQMRGPVKTFSIGFPDPAWDETEHARLVARHFGTEHHELRVEPHALAIMPEIARAYGEPFADPSAIPSLYLAEMAKRHVTVALNGDGGDESFGGYGRYLRGLRLAGAQRRVPPWARAAVGAGAAGLDTLADGRPRTARVRRIAEALTGDGLQGYLQTLNSFTAADRRALLAPEFAAGLTRPGEATVVEAWEHATASDPLDRMLETDVHCYLPGDLLVKMDIATMQHSLETRSPFLDHQFMEWAARLPARHKATASEGKILLKRALRGWVPDAILDRQKMGFGVPLERWFREELRHLPGEVLLDPTSRTAAYLNRGAVERVIASHHAGAADRSLQLWTLIQLELWHREVVEAPAV